MNQIASTVKAPTQGRGASISLSQRLYRTLWRWHFYAGLFCIPFVITLSVSGALYLFKPQFEAFTDRHWHNLTVQGQRIAVNEVIATAQASLPGAQFLSYELPSSPRDAALVNLRFEGQKYQVYVHPYTGEVLSQVAFDQRFMRQVREFHGELMAGRFGSILVELAACWAVVLILTGLYLWWPRNAKGLAGVLYPRLRQSKRIFWRDLHAVVGIWLSAFALFLIVSGLPWAMVWGGAFKEVRSWNKPVVQQDWNQSRADEKKSWGPMAVDTVDISEQALASIQALGFAPPVEVSVSNAQLNTLKVSSQNQNRPLRAEAWVDGRTGELLRQKPFADRPLVDRVIGVGISAHEGHLFGWFNQLLGVLVTLGLVFLSVTGTILWWRKKPAGRLGAPASLPQHAVAKVVALVILALGILLPIVGLSLLMLWLVEKLILRQIAFLRAWLGLA
ncbi:PepSY-associated TM helix domain-containing protein [Gilvimarinus chinensis]|uniref:PepSY-associated TM helix domain-containing protein n=1 Tax=Gilvimarinus chinensis TaxID=396005 RepID=UPI0003771D0A|nr:PepSY domain-containing protein [Gilvimarinus chinensis]